MSYKELKFATKKAAKNKAKLMNKKYGYNPSIFKIAGRKKPYVIVKPLGLKEMN